MKPIQINMGKRKKQGTSKKKKTFLSKLPNLGRWCGSSKAYLSPFHCTVAQQNEQCRNVNNLGT